MTLNSNFKLNRMKESKTYNNLLIQEQRFLYLVIKIQLKKV